MNNMVDLYLMSAFRGIARELAIRHNIDYHGLYLMSDSDVEFGRVLGYCNQYGYVFLAVRHTDGNFLPLKIILGTIAHELAHLKIGLAEILDHGPRWRDLYELYSSELFIKHGEHAYEDHK